MLDARMPERTPSRKKSSDGASGVASKVDVHIGKRLRLRRMMVGLSQEEVAQAVGVAFQQIQKYECAINRISTSRLWALAQALQCPVSFFYEGLDGANDPAPKTAREDVSTRQETLKLVRAYYCIKQAGTRRQILELASSLARPVEAPAA